MLIPVALTGIVRGAEKNIAMLSGHQKKKTGAGRDRYRTAIREKPDSLIANRLISLGVLASHAIDSS